VAGVVEASSDESRYIQCCFCWTSRCFWDSGYPQLPTSIRTPGNFLQLHSMPSRCTTRQRMTSVLIGTTGRVSYYEATFKVVHRGQVIIRQSRRDIWPMAPSREVGSVEHSIFKMALTPNSKFYSFSFNPDCLRSAIWLKIADGPNNQAGCRP
jgi:hypothetical protein